MCGMVKNINVKYYSRNKDPVRISIRVYTRRRLHEKSMSAIIIIMLCGCHRVFTEKNILRPEACVYEK